MKPRRRWVSPLDWVGSRITVEVKPPRYFPKPPGQVRAWFLRGGRRRELTYREMALVAAATFGGLIGFVYLAQLAMGHLPFGGNPLSALQGAVAVGVCAAALALSPRRRFTIVGIPLLLLALSFWAAVLHPGEPIFWQMIAGCILALALVVRFWGWRLDQ